MATFSIQAAPDNTTLATFKAWAQAGISTAFGNIGWVQANDTGQVVWTATVLTFTSVAVSGGNSVYAYSGFTGPTPRIGMSIIITGFATGGNNVTATITAVNPGVSVTVATTTQSNETHAGSGTTTALAARPNAGVYVYEIWKTNDGTGFDIYVKVEYGANSGNINSNALKMTIGTGSNLAGSLVNPSTTMGGDSANTSTTALPMHFSGDAGRMSMLLWNGTNSGSVAFVYNIERSYDNTGAVTASYATIYWWRTGNNSANQQTLFASGTLTTNETSGWAACMPRTASTGNVGSTTHVSPCFPLIGGLGNPSTGIMVFRATDFADNQLVFVTIYGIQQTYVTIGNNGTGTANYGQACGFMVRFS